MAQTQVLNVHLEAMEEATHKSGESEEAGHSGGTGLPVGKYPAGLLACGGQSNSYPFHYKQKTCSSGIL